MGGYLSWQQAKIYAAIERMDLNICPTSPRYSFWQWRGFAALSLVSVQGIHFQIPSFAQAELRIARAR